RADVGAGGAPPALAADLHRHLGPGVGQLGEARLQRLAVGVPGRVRPDRLVGGLGNLEMSVGGHRLPPLVPSCFKLDDATYPLAVSHPVAVGYLGAPATGVCEGVRCTVALLRRRGYALTQPRLA